MTTIEIDVNPDAAAAYQAADGETQKKVQLFLNTWLPDLSTMPRRSLDEIMDQMSDEAAAHGLTDDVLEAILRDAA